MQYNSLCRSVLMFYFIRSVLYLLRKKNTSPRGKQHYYEPVGECSLTGGRNPAHLHAFWHPDTPRINNASGAAQTFKLRPLALASRAAEAACQRSIGCSGLTAVNGTGCCGLDPQRFQRHQTASLLLIRAVQ